jgi:hypothetical protein
MSSTRTANAGSPLKQERWASSPLYERAIKANLVAQRCSVVESPAPRECLWFLQKLSMKAGGVRWAANELSVREDWLTRLCLDPSTNNELQILLPALSKLMVEYAHAQSEGVAVTKIARMIFEGLNYCRESRCMVLISGQPRTGKTFAAQTWCAQNPGKARYIQTPSSADDLTFFSAIARGLGITIESNAKTKNLRPRIEATLQTGDLVAVFDESANLWPGHSYRLARPSRICWLMQIINQGAAVALIETPQFFTAQMDYVKKTGWSAAQWDGRIERYIPLPERLSIEDLEAVARAVLPSANQRSIESLADYANLSGKYLAAIEHTVKQARYFAQVDGREEPGWSDIVRAMKDSVMPADSALAAAIETAAARRKCRAMVLPGQRGTLADSSQKPHGSKN